MNLKKGDIWVCKEPYCEAEVEVLRAAKSTCHGKFALRCCCGKELAPKESLVHAEAHAVAPGARTGHRG